MSTKDALLLSALYETLKDAQAAVVACAEIMEGDPKGPWWIELRHRVDAVLARAERETQP